ncbi:MAG: hypothetical protein NC218_05415 [Acetobacter sp.]|nr:hypothetical protein [Acetobacter sp.]
MTAKKYDEIKEIPDEHAFWHKPEECTFIINAEKYQKTGELEVKRVLKEDLLPEASASYVFFKREGCQGYPLKEQDLYLKSPSGYVGPFQMDSNACNTFLKHIKNEHPQWAEYATGSGTAGYMNFVKKCPDKEELLKTIEQYALSDYFNNRVGKPEVLAQNLAAQMQKIDENGNPDATRIPLHVIASLPTGVIARGNGNGFKKKIPTLTEQNIDAYCKVWISDKTHGVPAYNKLKEIDYLTPEIITQYQTMNLAGADKLQQQFQTIVEQKETSKELAHNKWRETFKISLQKTTPKLPQLEEMPELYGRKIKMDIKVDKKKNAKQNEQTNSQTTPHTQKNNIDTSIILSAKTQERN